MHVLHVTRNGSDLLHASISECCSFNWDVACSRREEDFGHFMISGLIARSDGKYDAVRWLEDVALDAGDDLTIRLLPGTGTTPIAKRTTYEELEALRQEVMRAEAAGEYDAARAARPGLLRNSCSIALLTPDGISRYAQATGLVEAALCSGSWIDVRPKEWRIRLCGMPAERSESGFWCPIEGDLHIKVRA